MAKVDDPKPPGWDEPPLPPRAREAVGKMNLLQQISLRHIMIALVYFAILFWAWKRVLDTNGAVQVAILGLLTGLGVCAFGVWAATKLTRYSFIGWIVFVIGFAAILVFTTGLLALPALPILIGSIVYLSLRRRSNHQEALLWVLTVAAERGMPLAPGVRAFSGQVAGMFEVWTESLAELLRQGATLPEALDRLPKLVPKGGALLIRMGWESGNLARGLRDAVDSRARRLGVLRTFGTRIYYLLAVVFVGQAIVMVMADRAVPRLQSIFRDFGIDQPELTSAVFQAALTLYDYEYFVIFVDILLLACVAAGLAGWGSMTVPIFDRLFVRRHSIMIFRASAVVFEGGRPIPPALHSMAQWYPTGWVRRKLALAAVDAGRGMDWAEALSLAGLISSNDVGVLASAQKAGNLGWALRELAETGERRWGYRLQAWSHALFVLAMIVLGGVVFVLAFAYFAPLATLITRLSR